MPPPKPAATPAPSTAPAGKPARTLRFLSGIQPTRRLHVGNYFGAIRDHVALQDQGDAYYFIADYHALTTVRDRATLRDNVLETAITYLAAGLDPDRCVLFRQSDVPE